ncbi:MAG: adenylate/guanylate cyclase domain-containing protein [Sneathiellales bacterium]|nr:adenylate/guanylate cyclase domain-containing protein [Sneathiellales bacterium]
MKRFRRFIASLGGFLSLKTGRPYALGILLIAFYFQVLDPPILSNFRNRVFDYYQQWHPRENIPNRPVTVVDIDEKSLLTLGQWPWPRNYLAALVQNARKMGAIVVGFDMVFAEEDRLSPNKLADSVGTLSKSAEEEISKLPSFDTIFAKQMKPSRVVLGISVNPTKSDVNNIGLNRIATLAAIGADPKQYLAKFTGLVGNIEELDASAAGRGMISLDQDFDGIVRRVPLATVVDQRIIPTLTLDMLRVATGRNVITQSNNEGILGFKIAGTLIPTDRNGRIWIQYSPFSLDQYVSASDLILGKADPKKIQGKFLLVGTSATGLKDLRASPLQSALPGVEMHLQLLENVLTQSYLYRPEYLAVLEWAGTIFTAMTLIVLVPLVGARSTLFVVLFISSVAISSSAYLFAEYSLLIDVSFTLFVGLLLYVTLVYANYTATEKERSYIQSAFSRYLSPDLVSQLSGSSQSLVLGGEEKEMTLLFCDIRGFTKISENFKDDPQGLTHLINRFLTPMTDAILSHKGTIDKYMGDAIMAFWNAPLNTENHEREAANSALLMLEKLEELNTQLKQEAEEEGLPGFKLNIGIGLNTGKCLVGNLGSQQRFDYSVLGDAVNLASRLEGQTKSYGFNIIVGEDTAVTLQDYALIELDLIAVKGRSAAVKIYALMGGVSLKESAQFEELQKKTSAFQTCYRNQQWDEALKILSDLLAREPKFATFALLFRDRININRSADLPGDWDGVYIAQEK